MLMCFAEEIPLKELMESALKYAPKKMVTMYPIVMLSTKGRTFQYLSLIVLYWLAIFQKRSNASQSNGYVVIFLYFKIIGIEFILWKCNIYTS